MSDERMTGSAVPLILVVSGEEGVRVGLGRDIARRFGADYSIAAADAPDSALDRIEAQAAAGGEIALVILTKGWRTRCRPTSCLPYIGCNPRPSESC